MKFLYLIAALVGIIIAVKAVQFVILLHNCFRERFRRPSGRIMQWNDLPDYLHRLFIIYEELFDSLGFSYDHLVLYYGVTAAEYSQQWYLIYYSEESKTYAAVSPSPTPERGDPVRIQFKTDLQDGRRILTLNGVSHALIGEIPQTIVVDPYSETIRGHYDAHLKAVAAAGSTPVGRVSAEQYLADELRLDNAYIENLCNKGWARPVDQGDQQRWRLTARAAVRTAFRATMRSGKADLLRTKRRKKLKGTNLSVLDAPIEIEAQAYRRVSHFRRSQSWGWPGKIAVFAVSLGLFIVAFGFALSWRFVVGFAVAVLFHELGHYLGMVLFKYRDRQILFLPLLGAATIGSDNRATPLQEVVVCLLGPAPGVLVGTILGFAGALLGNRFLGMCGTMLVVFNLLNMLPIMPLDGGRVMDRILFSRYGLLTNIFNMASALLLIAGGTLTGDRVLTFFGIFVGIGAVGSVARNNLLSKLRKFVEANGLLRTEDSLLPVVLKALRNKPFGNMSFSQKYTVARSLVDSLMRPPATTGQTVLSLVLYFSIWLLPVVVGIIFAVAALVTGASAGFMSLGPHL